MKTGAPIFLFSVILIICGCSSPIAVTSAADTESAIAALAAKADAGDPAAQNNLGSRYQTGDGVPKDLAKAFALYQKAAASGLPLPQSNLGFMYDMGLGVEQDRKLANEWYRKSAEQGYAPAMLNLGLNISDGVGAMPDLVEGMKWIDLARFFTQSEPDMQVKWRIRGAYDDLKARMTNKQFEEAQQRSTLWYKEFEIKQKRS